MSKDAVTKADSKAADEAASKKAASNGNGSNGNGASAEKASAEKTNGAGKATAKAGAAKAGVGAALAAGAKAPPRQARASKQAGKDGGDDNIEVVETENEGFFRKDLIHAMEGWSGSLIVQIVVIMVLAFMMLPQKEEIEFNQVMEIDDSRPEDQVQEIMDPNTEASSAQSAAAAAAAASASSNAAASVAAAVPTLQAFETDASDGAPTVNLGDMSLHSFGTSTLATDVGEEVKGEPSAVVDGVEEAMDRLTQEILMMMSKSKVLVVWLFDESHSQRDDQQEVRGKIDKVYTELGLRGAHRDDSLLTAVCSYGEKFTVHTNKPTNDVSMIQADIDKVPIDESGLENMCTAVGMAVSKYRSFAIQGKRKIALIMVSDESGEHEDNLANLEAALDVCKQTKTRVYTLGREAVFGYPYARLRWKHEETGLVFWRTINRGPESPMVESLQTNGFHPRHDAHPSGFGPYDQVRLCRETGGIFFMLPSLESNLVRGELRRYELEMMRPYLPDLVSRQEYIGTRDQNEMHAVLFQVIMMLNPHVDSRINLPDRFSIQPNDFLQGASTAIAKSEILVNFYDEAEKKLIELKKLRDQETDARWQANYDLTLAQVMSYKVRIYEYKEFLKQFAQSPRLPELPKTTHWDIHTKREMLTKEVKTPNGMTIAEYVDLCNQHLKQVSVDHPGTPWAARAEWELQRGYGVDFHEWYEDPRRAKIQAIVPKF